MNKTIVIVVVAAVVLVGGYFLLKGANPPAPSAPLETNQQTATPSPTESPAAGGAEHMVTYTDAGYSPVALTVKKRETVTFKNQSSRSMWTASAMHPTHRVYSGTSLDEHCPDAAGTAFDACKGFLPGESWSFKLDKTGIWKYHDHLNPGVFGSITVE